ncbi:MAG: phosphoenolpyruvate synthase, partial [Candidatus Omnitrophica bacterium]|nr:phosphoenolpyruvate synthase [Candidatus Omnitrophota bacterium]
WGSRGDIKLGVNVTYADINNTAMLIEVARRVGNYVPDLSFGTHFFQDLVETDIFYLALFPSRQGVHINNGFFGSTPNLLRTLKPEYQKYEHVVKVFDIAKRKLNISSDIISQRIICYFQ